MKNFLKLIILSIILIISLSCKDTKKNSGYELALITDIGTIDDKSFTQGSWEGLKKYAEEKGITYKYYKPAGKDTDSKIDSIYLAISSGAKLIVTPGYLFEPAIYKVQDTHPEINFVLLDGTPQDGTYTDFRIEKNVYAVLYAEEEAGFLAGYGVVKEGYTNLGVMGGMAEPSVIRFGYGFVQGADYAAKELGVKNIKIDYSINNLPMGSTIKNTSKLNFNISAIDSDENDKIDEIQVISNNGEIIKSKTFNSNLAKLEFTLKSNKNKFYYIKVIQNNDKISVTSPIWIE